MKEYVHNLSRGQTTTGLKQIKNNHEIKPSIFNRDGTIKNKNRMVGITVEFLEKSQK